MTNGNRRPSAGHGRPLQAANAAVSRRATRLRVPGVGDVMLPPADRLAFYLGVAALAALEVIEWPVALAVAAGHLMADNARSTTLRDFGEALEQA